MIFSYKGKRYPNYLKQGNACQYIAPVALKFCRAPGLDVGGGKWPLEGATCVDLKNGGDAMNLPEGLFNYVFSSHCLEHLENPVAAIDHWKTRLVVGGVLFLYLPHPAMEYWLPQNNRKHLHTWTPEQMDKLITDLGFYDVMTSGCDLAWGFAVVGFKG